jgi:hypothetical protein
MAARVRGSRSRRGRPWAVPGFKAGARPGSRSGSAGRVSASRPAGTTCEARPPRGPGRVAAAARDRSRRRCSRPGTSARRSAVERSPVRERLHLQSALLELRDALRRMAAGVEQHVGERVSHLPRAGEDPQVIPVGEHPAGPPERPVHRWGEARRERLHPSSERIAIARLDDRVRVIGLDRVVDEPEVLSLVAAPEGGLELADDLTLTQGRQAAIARDGEAAEFECALSRSSHYGVSIGLCFRLVKRVE